MPHRSIANGGIAHLNAAGIADRHMTVVPFFAALFLCLFHLLGRHGLIITGPVPCEVGSEIRSLVIPSDAGPLNRRRWLLTKNMARITPEEN